MFSTSTDSIIVYEIKLFEGSAFHVTSEDMVPPELVELIVPFYRKRRCVTVDGPIVIDKGIVLHVPALEVELRVLFTKGSQPLI